MKAQTMRKNFLSVCEATVDSVKDSMNRSFHINTIATIAATAASSSGAKDWANNLNKVEAPFEANGTMRTIIEGFYFKRPPGLSPDVEITSDNILEGFVIDKKW